MSPNDQPQVGVVQTKVAFTCDRKTTGRNGSLKNQLARNRGVSRIQKRGSKRPLSAQTTFFFMHYKSEKSQTDFFTSSIV